MDTELIDNLSQGCKLVQPFLASDGRCLVLGVKSYTEGRGYTWEAIACERGPLLSPLPIDWSINRVFRFGVRISLEAIEYGSWHPYSDEKSIEHLEHLMGKLALAHLKFALSKPFENNGIAELRLISTSPPGDWKIPEIETAAQIRVGLRNNLLHFLSDRHADGFLTVSMNIIWSKFCAPIDQIEATLNTLEAEKLVQRTVEPALRITPAGLRATELLSPPFPAQNKLMQSESPSPVPNAEFDVFLSYASEDIIDAERLHAALKRKGISVWFAPLQISWGGSLTRTLEAGMERSRYGVLLISAAYLEKPWPMAELARWLHHTYISKQRVMIPVRLRLTHGELINSRPLLEDVISGELTADTELAATKICEAIGK